MTEKQLYTILIDKYTDLQRLKTATNLEKEINYQLKTTKTKLAVMGIDAEHYAL